VNNRFDAFKRCKRDIRGDLATGRASLALPSGSLHQDIINSERLGSDIARDAKVSAWNAG